jgi:hypothetical protein
LLLLSVEFLEAIPFHLNIILPQNVRRFFDCRLEARKAIFVPHLAEALVVRPQSGSRLAAITTIRTKMGLKIFLKGKKRQNWTQLGRHCTLTKETHQSPKVNQVST